MRPLNPNYYNATIESNNINLKVRPLNLFICDHQIKYYNNIRIDASKVIKPQHNFISVVIIIEVSKRFDGRKIIII